MAFVLRTEWLVTKSHFESFWRLCMTDTLLLVRLKSNISNAFVLSQARVLHLRTTMGWKILPVCLSLLLPVFLIQQVSSQGNSSIKKRFYSIIAIKHPVGFYGNKDNNIFLSLCVSRSLTLCSPKPEITQYIRVFFGILMFPAALWELWRSSEFW